MQTFKSGETVGNGAAINVELGWIPDFVIVTNVTDGDKIHMGYPNRMAIPFSGGGTTEIAAGATITGATSAATAIVKTVLLYSGSWAGGDAAGFFIIERDTLTGTFTSENVYISSDTTSGTDDATVTANVTHTVDIDTEVAGATGNAAISGYAGSAASNAKGFTIGSTIAEEAKLLRWTAWRNE
jgi:hypothetical protein